MHVYFLLLMMTYYDPLTHIKYLNCPERLFNTEVRNSNGCKGQLGNVNSQGGRE